MKVKVCGMRYSENIQELVALRPDYIGFIFYPKSPRYVGDDIALQSFLPKVSITKVGVFVNASLEEIKTKVAQFSLDIVQLHGRESVDLCQQIQSLGIPIIKAFSIKNEVDIALTQVYTDACDYFLFDTQTPDYGGSGAKFDWQVLDAYTGKIPFFLSGGIGLYDVQAIQSFSHPQLMAIDVNSKFETSPAHKDIAQLHSFIQQIKTHNNG